MMTFYPPGLTEHFCAYSVRVEWTKAEIKRRREAKGLSQEALAKRLGLSRRAITNWETGVREPRGSSLRALEAELGDAPTPEVSLKSASLMEVFANLAGRYADLEARHTALLAEHTALLAELDRNPVQPRDTPSGRYRWRTEDGPTARWSKENGGPVETGGQGA